MKVRVENVVISGRFPEKLSPEKLKKIGAKYDPHRFPGAVVNLDGKTFLLFRSGSFVGTGFKSVEEVEEHVRRLASRLRKAGFGAEAPEYEVVNIVTMVDLEVGRVNLNSLALALGVENVEYYPEIFPGLVYRLNRAVALIFSSGKAVVTGCRSMDCVREAAKTLEQLFS